MTTSTANPVKRDTLASSVEVLVRVLGDAGFAAGAVLLHGGSVETWGLDKRAEFAHHDLKTMPSVCFEVSRSSYPGGRYFARTAPTRWQTNRWRERGVPIRQRGCVPERYLQFDPLLG